MVDQANHILGIIGNEASNTLTKKLDCIFSVGIAQLRVSEADWSFTEFNAGVRIPSTSDCPVEPCLWARTVADLH